MRSIRQLSKNSSPHLHLCSHINPHRFRFSSQKILNDSQHKSNIKESHHNNQKQDNYNCRYDSKLPIFGNVNTFNILLIRHAESIGNKDKSVLASRADHSIPLSEEGHKQAVIAGEIIKEYFETRKSSEKKDILDSSHSTEFRSTGHCRLWVSPYLRSRETAKHIEEVAGKHITDKREHILLGEQQFGLFEGRTLNELKRMHPKEFDHFTKCIEAEGRFWARPPLGESRFDVAKRVHQAFGTFHRDSQMHGIRDLIIVSHGVAIRAFIMMWLHLCPEWFEKETNPNFCSIRLLEDNIDKGYLFEGFTGEENLVNVHY